MTFASFDVVADTPLIATAIHCGHDLREEVAELMILDEETRRREEDPYTDRFASRFSSHVVAHRSRFEVDLNRERDDAVYQTPGDAWGLELWREPLPEEVVERSLQLHDGFYDDMAVALDKLVAEHGGFVLYDIHSYNHRRGGPEAEPEPAEQNPEVNLGTGSMPGKWRPVADAFLEAMDEEAGLDARENVKFRGRQLAAWSHARYGEVGAVLAIEFKKVFMDEWSDEVDWPAHRRLGDALEAAARPVVEEWRRLCR